MAKTVALILAGAVAKGAFEAGALQAVADTDLKVVRICAASSGALNGAAYAAAIRAKRERDGVRELIDLWLDHATWSNVFHPNLRDLLHLRALSDATKVRGILRDNIKPATIPPDERVPIELRLVVAPLLGMPVAVGDEEMLTYEHVLEYANAQFDTAESLDDIFTGVLASSAFPGVFEPVDVPGVGLCIDGGTTNNTPVRHALEGTSHAEIEAVIVISPVRNKHVPDIRPPQGAALVEQLTDMLINERLYRDLKETIQVNSHLEQLAALADLTKDQFDAVKLIFGLQNARHVDVVQIRPDQELPGGAFDGFFHRDDRKAYVDAGYACAKSVLATL